MLGRTQKLLAGCRAVYNIRNSYLRAAPGLEILERVTPATIASLKGAVRLSANTRQGSSITG
jgi:hypothetical protein